MNKFQILLIFSSSTLILGGEVTSSCYRPCPDFDVDCIRNYFESTAPCTKRVGEVPRHLIRPHSDISIPSVNVTGTRTNLDVLGFDWKIIEFYINPATNRAVLEVKITDLKVDIKDLEINYWLPGREPEVVWTTAKEHFPSLRLTTVFENGHTLGLEDSTSYPFFDVVPNIILGPELNNHKGFQKPFKQYNDNLEAAFKEAFSAPLQVFAPIFIQYTICDYGLKEFY